MRRPDQWYNVPYASFVDGIGPSVNSEFLNSLQEGLADIVGATFGRSATLLTDEFEELSWPAGKAGNFSVAINLNGTHATAAPLGVGDHGLLKANAVAAGAFEYTLNDASSWLGTFDFSFSGKALVEDRAILNSVGSRGFLIGLRNPPAALGLEAAFVAGSDQANWQVLIGTSVTDSGIPVVNGAFRRFQICRKNGTIFAFIDGVLIAMAAFPNPLTNVIREIRINAPTAGAGQGFIVDYHRVWYQR